MQMTDMNVQDVRICRCLHVRQSAGSRALTHLSCCRLAVLLSGHCDNAAPSAPFQLHLYMHTSSAAGCLVHYTVHSQHELTAHHTCSQQVVTIRTLCR